MTYCGTRLIRVSLLALIFIVGYGCQKSSQNSELPKTAQGVDLREMPRPALLGTGLAVLPDTEFDKTKRVDKIKKSDLGTYVGPWAIALGAATENRYEKKMIVFTFPVFASQLDTLWDGDKFQPSKIDIYIKRLRMLPILATKKWQEELDKKLSPIGGSSSELDSIGFLIQMDRLFSDDKFKKEESENLLSRLHSMSPDAIVSWGKAINGNTNQAAIMLIQADNLFDQNHFQMQSFVNGLVRFNDEVKKEPSNTAAPKR